ncbi:ABC transporter substrate-binding protein [Xanthobacter sp. V3C-3]|uniref:ABC transporter substrate-binding protein n=1 Tax=Xanthobacter lutulentifluminis TaxID=3119935 RepID=UPI003726CD89
MPRPSLPPLRAAAPHIRPGRAIAFVALAATALVAASLSGGTPSARADEPLTAINLQLTPWTVIAQEKGIFKDEFEKIGVKKVNLIASGGADLVGAEAAAVNNGAIAIAQRMIYPATVHRANGLDGVVIWASEPSNRYRAPILARADNDKINSVADLDGKKFGSSRISCYWSSPFEMTTKAGLPFDSRDKQGRIRYTSIDNSAVAITSVLTGATDATTAHLAAGAFAGAWLSGKLKVIGRSPDDGVYVNNAGRVTYFARRDFVNKYPQVVKAFLAARERTREWTYDHVDEAAQIVADKTRVPLEVAKFQISHAGEWEFMAGEPNADRARTAIKTFQAWYVANGDDILAERSLTEAQIDAFIDGRFFAGGEYSIYN